MSNYRKVAEKSLIGKPWGQRTAGAEGREITETRLVKVMAPHEGAAPVFLFS